METQRLLQVIEIPFSLEIFGRNYCCLGTQLAHNSSYHPQYYGKTEIVKKCLEGYLH